ncbi:MULTISPECIES: MoaD/ThiS family protein [Sphingomonas]|uniref:MoaD/ThiS family protein n=1 Tax=Sphingomonas TaxID=13687 RepID=UPI000DEEF94F|nr:MULTISPECIES: MoaD/ThiS family protein [Sphingomonas]
MRVRFFGLLADLAGRERALDWPGEGGTVAALIERLGAEAGLGAALAGPGVRTCVGRDFVGPEQWLAGDEIVEFWPPVSGG